MVHRLTEFDQEAMGCIPEDVLDHFRESALASSGTSR